MILYGLIGYPLGHSFSKNYFTKKFLEEGFADHRYELFPIKNAGEIKIVLKEHPDLLGLNVTIPYKQEILPYLSESKIPKGLHACNCIKINGDKIIGYNTDIIGFERSLIAQLKNVNINALVLGNGGAAQAIKFVLNKLKINYKIVARVLNNKDVSFTYKDLNEQIIKDHLLIVNTTPLGTFPEINTYPEIPYQFLTPQHFLFDLVYNPEKTLFLSMGEKKGATIQNGFNMLIEQAEESWNIWNELSG